MITLRDEIDVYCLDNSIYYDEDEISYKLLGTSAGEEQMLDWDYDTVDSFIMLKQQMAKDADEYDDIRRYVLQAESVTEAANDIVDAVYVYTGCIYNDQPDTLTEEDAVRVFKDLLDFDIDNVSDAIKEELVGFDLLPQKYRKDK